MEAAPGYEATDENCLAASLKRFILRSVTLTSSHLQQLLVQHKKPEYHIHLRFGSAPERMHTLAADSRTSPVFMLKVKHRDSRQTLPEHHCGETLDLV